MALAEKKVLASPTAPQQGSMHPIALVACSYGLEVGIEVLLVQIEKTLNKSPTNIAVQRLDRKWRAILAVGRSAPDNQEAIANAVAH